MFFNVFLYVSFGVKIINLLHKMFKGANISVSELMWNGLSCECRMYSVDIWCLVSDFVTPHMEASKLNIAGSDDNNFLLGK